MTSSARLSLRKALLLLDHGRSERGESVLRQALDQAVAEDDLVTMVTALCCLGELLHETGRLPAAIATLTRCVDADLPDDLDDLCASERHRARALLARLQT